MKFKNIDDIKGLPIIQENLYNSLVKPNLMHWYDGPQIFFAEYEDQEVYVYAIQDKTYKVYRLSEESMTSATDEHVVIQGEAWWDFLADENCIGVWYW